MTTKTQHPVRLAALAATTALLLAACGGSSESNVTPGPDRIDFDSTNLQPEGVAFDPWADEFLVGSRTQGTIHHVSDSGVLRLLTEDSPMSSTLGLEVDHETARVLAAGETAPNTPALGSFDLATGATVAVIDLSSIAPGPARLANDVALSSSGRAYVTDTLAGAIYRVEPDGTASVFLANHADLVLPNGIVAHPDGFLLVNSISGPSLLRVPLDEPGGIQAVTSPFNVSGDGMVLLEDGTLAIVGEAVRPDGTVEGPGVTVYATADGWQSAEAVASWVADEAATTAALRAGNLHAIYAGLFQPERETYSIVKTNLSE